ncbi:MAG: enoyl-CoA hydratase/isomerase family protein [Bacteroidetes bacterium]|nr:MAG: enoyl-CoA hydratase/isomerase family protein [Bacteroidota bacterium]
MELLKYRVENRVAYITLNRPEKRNAFSYDLVTALKKAFSDAEHDRNVKVIVLESTGKVFSAGADLGYLQSLQKLYYEENLEDSLYLKDLYLQIYRHSKVVIAKIQGHAIAGGCGLATVCDFVFSVPEAKFGYTEVKIGFVPAIVMVFLLRKIGEAKAKSLLLSGDLVDAKQMFDYGIVNELVEANQLDTTVNEFAQHLCNTCSAQSLQATKQMIADIQEFSLENALNQAAAMNARARNFSDCQKGMAAFLNKESLKW